MSAGRSYGRLAVALTVTATTILAALYFHQKKQKCEMKMDEAPGGKTENDDVLLDESPADANPIDQEAAFITNDRGLLLSTGDIEEKQVVKEEKSVFREKKTDTEESLVTAVVLNDSNSFEKLEKPEGEKLDEKEDKLTEEKKPFWASFGFKKQEEKSIPPAEQVPKQDAATDHEEAGDTAKEIGQEKDDKEPATPNKGFFGFGGGTPQPAKKAADEGKDDDGKAVNSEKNDPPAETSVENCDPPVTEKKPLFGFFGSPKEVSKKMATETGEADGAETVKALKEEQKVSKRNIFGFEIPEKKTPEEGPKGEESKAEESAPTAEKGGSDDKAGSPFNEVKPPQVTNFFQNFLKPKEPVEAAAASESQKEEPNHEDPGTARPGEAEIEANEKSGKTATPEAGEKEEQQQPPKIFQSSSTPGPAQSKQVDATAGSSEESPKNEEQVKEVVDEAKGKDEKQKSDKVEDVKPKRQSFLDAFLKPAGTKEKDSKMDAAEPTEGTLDTKASAEVSGAKDTDSAVEST